MLIFRNHMMNKMSGALRFTRLMFLPMYDLVEVNFETDEKWLDIDIKSYNKTWNKIRTWYLVLFAR